MNGRCFYCGGEMFKPHPRRANSQTIDHLVPKSHGGKRELGNIVACHRKCNEDKGDRTLEQYRRTVARRHGIIPEKFKFPGELKEPLWIGE